MEVVDENTILNIGLSILQFDGGPSMKNYKRFGCAYGACPKVCLAIFQDLQRVPEVIDRVVKVNVLLMTLHWLYKYPTETLLCSMFGFNREQTVRELVDAYLYAIWSLKPFKIQWPFDDHYDHAVYKISVDGTHCPIQEPNLEPDTLWYSHKFNGPGVAYEIAVCLETSNIVWINGPFKAGESDLAIFRKPNGLKQKLPRGMLVVADNGYQGELQISAPNFLDDEETKNFKKRARARHETVNGRLKAFSVLNACFRHSLSKHKTSFEAVCIIVQYKFENDRGMLFDI